MAELEEPENSPIIDSSEDEAPDESLQGTTCHYEGKAYRLTEEVCINHRVHKCGRRGWYRMIKRC